MIAISENVKDAIESIEPKNLILEFDDGTIIDNEDIAMESMELTQSITEDDTLRFGEINSSCFKVEITGSPKKYKGLWFNASLHCGDYSVPLGKFCVDSDEYTSGRQYRSIVAYDALAYVTNTDVTEWYEKLKFPISIRNMRNSLFSFLDIEQEDVTLINDAYMVEKTIAGEEISALMVLRAICELNATFGVINNYGKFKYVKINNLERAGLNPSEELYTEDVYDDVLTKADYFQDSLTFEEFDTEKITKLRIQEVENDIGVSVGEDGNEYIITDNFLTYGDTEENIRVVVENLFNYAKHLTYTPTEVSCTGKPWLEVGDMLQVYADDKVLNVPILSRTLSGIQSIIDSYTAQGTEYCEEPQENGLQTEIRKLKSRSNVLTRTLDETISEISRIETETKKYTDEAIKESTSNTNSKIEEKLKSYSTTTEMNSKIEQTANSLNSSINEKVNETKTYINGEITTTKNELSNQIEQTSSSLKSEISKNYVTNGSLQEATNYLQQQIDGAIETFSGSSVPTLSNSPASGWETNEIKDTHVGDLYIVNSSGGDHAGFYYRFEKFGNTYKWTLLKDNEITKALQDAKEANEKAQEVARELAENYITESETKSAIDQATNKIQLAVSEKYSTKAEVTSAKSEAISSANANTANQLKNYSTTADSKAYANSVSNSALDSAKKYTDAVEVGGRNYIINSTNEWSGNITCSGWQKYVYSTYSIAWTELLSQTVTFGGYIRNISGDPVGIMLHITTPDRTIGYYQSVGTSFVSSGNEKFISYTTTLPDDIKTITGISLAIRHYSKDANNTVVNIKGWKLEKGNRATDWTPAPEDVEADATNKANSALESAKANTDAKLVSYSTTAEMNSAIELKANSITNSVNEKITETKKYADSVGGNAVANANQNTENLLREYSTTTEMNSAIEQKSNSIISTVDEKYTSKTEFQNLQIGGRNLLKGSAVGYAATGSDYPNVSTRTHGKIIVKTAGSGNAYVWIQNKLAITPTELFSIVGEEFTYSVEMKVTGQFEWVSSAINCRQGSTYNFYASARHKLDTEEWVRISGTAKVTAVGNGYTNVLSQYNWSSAEVGATIEYRNLKLEKGNRATDWTPAPEDVEADIASAQTEAIKEAKSYIKQTADNIDIAVSKKVGYDELISSINLSAEGAKINASKIDIAGAVTFSSLSNDVKNAIDLAGANASSANTNASSALNSVNNSVKSVTLHYLATSANSGVTTSTSGWTTTPQNITSTKKYLWTYQTVTSISGTSTNSTPVISGVYGDKGATGATGSVGATGNGISSIKEYYQVSTSNTTAPTSWVTTVPTMTATNKYLWNYETITYTNGSTATTAKRVIGVYGDKGATGATGAKGDKGDKGATGSAGATGVGISNVVPLYYLKSNATAPSAPTSAVASASTSHSVWTTAIPNYINGYTYFTCTQTLYTNGTYKWSAVVADNALTSANKNAYDANIKANDVANTTVRKYSYTIDLSNTTTYNEDTYYPVIGGQIPKGGYRSLSVAVQLNSGTKPAWSTHTAGFTCNLAVRVKQWGWGTATDHMGWIDDASYKFCNKMPAYFQQMGNSSLPVFYLRGGGKYFLYADYPSTWTPHTSTYTSNSQSVSPTTTPSNWSYLANNWRMETAIANWCHDNNVTYIDGSKIYAGTVSAKQINVNELFAQKITIQDSVSPVPTQMDVDLINRYTIGNASLNSTQLKLYDFNGDGKVTALDAIYAKKLSTGELTYDDLPNYIPTKASATLKLSFSNLNEVIKIYGDSPFQAGKYETSIGAGEIKTQSVTATQANLKSLFIDGTQINLLIKDESMDGYNLYTTAAWSAGSGGFLWLCEEAGWYYIDVTFYGVSGTMDNAQFQIFRSSGGVHTSLITVGFVWNWTGTMPMQHVQTIQYLNKNDAIYPYVHTGIAGVQLNTGIRALRLAGQ